MSTRIAASATTKKPPSPTTISAPLCTLEGPQPIFIELDAEAGLFRNVDVAIGVDLEGLGEHEVAVLWQPVRRVVRELDERAVRNGRRHVQVRGKAKAVRPGVRRKEQSCSLRDAGDLLRHGDAAGERAVRLIDVEAALVEVHLE